MSSDRRFLSPEPRVPNPERPAYLTAIAICPAFASFAFSAASSVVPNAFHFASSAVSAGRRSATAESTWVVGALALTAHCVRFSLHLSGSEAELRRVLR